MTVASTPRGGAWLIEETGEVFTRERLSDEQRLIARTAEQFVDQDVMPRLDDLERKDWACARTLVQRSAELGLLATDVPESYGGLALDKISSLIVAERIARAASFATTYGAQANLCILPLVLFGTPDQKQRYRAPDQADPENQGVADGVADAPERQQQAGIGQYVADHDPLDVTDRKVESPGNGGEGDIHRRVQLSRGRAERDHGDLPGLCVEQARRRMGRIAFGNRSHAEI